MTMQHEEAPLSRLARKKDRSGPAQRIFRTFSGGRPRATC